MAEIESPTLGEVAHAANDDLFDVLTLLNGALKILVKDDHAGSDETRLVWMAMEKVRSIQSLFNPHI